MQKDLLGLLEKLHNLKEGVNLKNRFELSRSHCALVCTGGSRFIRICLYRNWHPYKVFVCYISIPVLLFCPLNSKDFYSVLFVWTKRDPPVLAKRTLCPICRKIVVFRTKCSHACVLMCLLLLLVPVSGVKALHGESLCNLISRYVTRTVLVLRAPRPTAQTRICSPSRPLPQSQGHIQ